MRASAAHRLVLEPLGAANAVEAALTPLEVGLLSAQPNVVVTPNLSISLAATSTDPSHTPSAAYATQSGATSVWGCGDTGAGVNVAVLDTGIDALPDFSGRLVGGVDLSGGHDPFSDQYGHGTFVAGLIAGDGASSAGAYVGEAPGAGLVSVKVAGASGSTDLATVIRGIGWVMEHAATLHIRVLNLSLGYVPIQSTTIDPLDQAVEAAWRSGIVVTVSAGNDGPSNGTILSPGDDPLVITSGAVDDLGQAVAARDVMTTFSAVGPTNPDGWFKPDLVTSGRSVVSLAAPASTIYNDVPEARVGAANFVGSGTSFSSAITAGAVALLLGAQPTLSPDATKARLLATTSAGPVGDPFVDGHGVLDVAAAASSTPVAFSQSNSPPASSGLVTSLFDLLRSSITSSPGTVALSATWSVSSWNPANWNPANWKGAAWNGAAWNGAAWNGAAWNGAAWNSDAWS